MNTSEQETKCNGNCGMNYCDEYGCIENKPEGDVSHLLTPPPASIKTEGEDEIPNAPNCYNLYESFIWQDGFKAGQIAPPSPVGIDVDAIANALKWAIAELDALNERTYQDVGIETQLEFAKEALAGYEASPQSSAIVDDDEVYDIDDIDTIRQMLIKAKKSSSEWCKKAMELSAHNKEIIKDLKETREQLAKSQSSTSEEEENQLWIDAFRDIKANLKIKELKLKYKISKR